MSTLTATDLIKEISIIGEKFTKWSEKYRNEKNK